MRAQVTTIRPWFFPRHTEVWFGLLGFFFSREIIGVELPNGQFYGYAKQRNTWN